MEHRRRVADDKDAQAGEVDDEKVKEEAVDQVVDQIEEETRGGEGVLTFLEEGGNRNRVDLYKADRHQVVSSDDAQV